MASIGLFNTLTVLRETASGYYLDGGSLGEILLPGTHAPKDLAWGSEIEVFIYPDSEDRLVATTERPLATAGEFACLEVLTVHPQIGAFLDWGLGKDLLLPFREQAERVEAGERVVVYIKVDERSQRVVATTKWKRFLEPAPRRLAAGERVSFLITHRTPLGYHAIVEGRCGGLLYHSALGIELEVGSVRDGYVLNQRPDGKLDLGLDAPGPRSMGDLGEKIMAVLEAQAGSMPFDDHSSPEDIREVFGTSKKAFKRALGTLYKQRRIVFPSEGGTRRAE